MTVSQLINKLSAMEANGFGDYQVMMSVLQASGLNDLSPELILLQDNEVNIERDLDFSPAFQKYEEPIKQAVVIGFLPTVG
jgi:hypothetical protein